MDHFADRLVTAIRNKRTPLIVGLDPRLESLPEAIRKSVQRDNPASIAAAFERFCLEVLDVVAPRVPAVKPQWAFFEQLGSCGIAALERIIAAARQHDLLIIADAKRGDIGTTAEAYADAFFRDCNGQPFCDAVTLNPFLGLDTLQPFLAQSHLKSVGMFALVKTSNPGSDEFQNLSVDRDLRFYEYLADRVQELALQHRGLCGYGSLGAVAGATYPRQLAELRCRMPNTWLLVPGFGAQGGSAADTAGALDSQGLGAVVNSSRAILFAYQRPEFKPASATAWQKSVERACLQSIEELRAETSASQL